MSKVRNAFLLTAASAELWLPTSAAAGTAGRATLMEQSNSGVTGSVVLAALEDGGLNVVSRSEGLVPDQPHARHLHGSAHGGHFGCPTLADNDIGGDGVLTNEEATGEYGTVFLALTTRSGVTAQDGLAVDRMSVADANGGMNDNDKYDVDALGVSTYAENLRVDGVPDEATNPASCCLVEGAGAGTPARNGIEAGEDPVSDLNTPLVAAGITLLLGSAVLTASAPVAGLRKRSGGR